MRDHEIRAMRVAGHTLQEIGHLFGLTRERIRQILGSEYNFNPRPPLRTTAFIERARDLWDEGLTANQIARRLGVSRNVVIGVAHRRHFPARVSPIIRSVR